VEKKDRLVRLPETAALANIKEAKDRLGRLPEVKALTSISVTTIYRYIKQGAFLKPFSIGLNMSAWSYNALADWIERRKNREPLGGPGKPV
jgi:predicted DNA-binding transcriptional regulator AlpA